MAKVKMPGTTFNMSVTNPVTIESESQEQDNTIVENTYDEDLDDLPGLERKELYDHEKFPCEWTVTFNNGSVVHAASNSGNYFKGLKEDFSKIFN